MSGNTELSDSATYISPDYARGRLYDLGLDQKIWLAGWFVTALAAMFILPTLPLKAVGVVVLLLVGGIGGLSFNEGQGYLLPSDYLQSRRLRKHGSFVSPGDLEGDDRPTIKYALRGIPLGIEQGEGVFGGLPTGFIVPSSANRMAFVITYGGTRRPAQSWDERMRLEQLPVDVLAQAAAVAGYGQSGFSLASIIGARPADPQDNLETLSWAIHPDFINPKPGSPEERVANAHDMRFKTMYLTGCDPVSAYVITLDTPKAWRAALNGNAVLTTDAIDESMVQTLIEHITRGLSDAGIPDVKCLNLLELDEFVRVQLGVKNSGKLHKWLADRRWQYRTMSARDIIQDLLASSPWPDELIKIGPDYMFADGTYFRVYRTINFAGKRLSRPGAFLSLQSPQGTRWNMTTACGRVISSIEEEKHMTRSIVWSQALRLTTDSNGERYRSQREKDELEHTEHEQTDLYRMDAPVYKSDRLVTVAAPTKPLLRLYCIMTLAAHTLRMVGLRPIKLETRQSRALSRCLLGVDD